MRSISPIHPRLQRRNLVQVARDSLTLNQGQLEKISTAFQQRDARTLRSVPRGTQVRLWIQTRAGPSSGKMMETSQPSFVSIAIHAEMSGWENNASCPASQGEMFHVEHFRPLWIWVRCWSSAGRGRNSPRRFCSPRLGCCRQECSAQPRVTPAPRLIGNTFHVEHFDSLARRL